MTDDERENVIKQAAKQEASDYQSGDFEQGAWWALSNLSALGYDIAVANPAASAQPVADTDRLFVDALHYPIAASHPPVPADVGMTDEEILACLDDREPVRQHHGAAVFEYRLFALIDFARKVIRRDESKSG